MRGWFEKRGGMEVGSIVMAGSMMPQKEALARRRRSRRRRRRRRRRRSKGAGEGGRVEGRGGGGFGEAHVRQRWSLGTQSTKICSGSITT